jgi:hypothetical protein
MHPNAERAALLADSRGLSAIGSGMHVTMG